MPEWITPLLRVLAPMPSLGICSTRNTSLQRCETARATAQPTTPPPMMTMFARSTVIRIDDLRQEARGKEMRKQRERDEKLASPQSCSGCIFGLKHAREGVDICLA